MFLNLIRIKLKHYQRYENVSKYFHVCITKAYFQCFHGFSHFNIRKTKSERENCGESTKRCALMLRYTVFNVIHHIKKKLYFVNARLFKLNDNSIKISQYNIFFRVSFVFICINEQNYDRYDSSICNDSTYCCV